MCLYCMFVCTAVANKPVFLVQRGEMRSTLLLLFMRVSEIREYVGTGRPTGMAERAAELETMRICGDADCAFSCQCLLCGHEELHLHNTLRMLK